MTGRLRRSSRGWIIAKSAWANRGQRRTRMGGAAVLAERVRRPGIRAEGRCRSSPRRGSGSSRCCLPARGRLVRPEGPPDIAERTSPICGRTWSCSTSCSRTTSSRRPASDPVHDPLLPVAASASGQGVRGGLLAANPDGGQHRERLLALQPDRRDVAAGPRREDPRRHGALGRRTSIDWHNVNIAQGFRAPAVYYLQAKDIKLLGAAERNYRKVMGSTASSRAADSRPTRTPARLRRPAPGIRDLRHRGVHAQLRDADQDRGRSAVGRPLRRDRVQQLPGGA